MSSGFNSQASDGFQVSVSSLTLGTLYEAILAFSSHHSFDKFWPAVCQNSRWLIPSQRLAVLLHDEEQGFEIVGFFEKGRFAVPDETRYDPGETALGHVLGKRNAQWIANAKDELDDPDCNFCAEFFKDGAPTLFALPINIDNKPYGFLLFAMAAIADTDQTMLTALGTVYAQHVGMSCMLIEAAEERQRQQEELEETRHELDGAQRQLVESEKMAALGGLVAGIAHEINTPVGIGVTAASHLETRNRDFEAKFKDGSMKRSDLSSYLDTTQQSCELILSNLNRAAEIIGSFKQVAVDQSSEERREFKVGEYLQEVLLSLRPEIKRTKHAVEVTGDGDVVLDTYPGAFAQIVTNFVMNSLTHAYEPEEEGHISIDMRRRDSRFVFSYTDDGKGIPAEHLGKIFEPFFTTKRNQGGSGLGMHIVYNLVTQRLNGRIDIDSHEGEGTRFTIDMPIRQA